MAFNNLQSQVAYMLAMGLNRQQVKSSRAFHSSMSFIKGGAGAPQYKDKVFVLESKESIRSDSANHIRSQPLMGFLFPELKHGGDGVGRNYVIRIFTVRSYMKLKDFCAIVV